MNIKKTALILMSLWMTSIYSQEILPVSKAIELALENNYGIKIVANTNRIAKNNTSLLNSGYLPTLTGNSGITYLSLIHI